MGQVASDLSKSSSDEVKEQIEILQEMAENILKGEAATMEARAYEDKSLPIVAVTYRKKYVSMGATAGVSEKVGSALGDLFKGNILSALKTAITAGLEMFLGNASAGRSEMSQFHVAFKSSALLRLDIYFYKYQLKSKGLKDHSSNMFCYVAQIGVLDTLKVNPQVTLYELTKTLSVDDMEAIKEQLERETQFAEELYGCIRQLTKVALTGGSSRGRKSYRKIKRRLKLKNEKIYLDRENTDDEESNNSQLEDE